MTELTKSCLNKSLEIENEIKNMALHDISYQSYQDDVSNLDIKNFILRKTSEFSPAEQKRIAHEFEGDGPLHDVFLDPDITEIMINSPFEIWFEKNGAIYKLPDQFCSEISFNNFLHRLCSQAKTEFNVEHPSCNGKYKNFRLHIVGGELTQKYPSITLRRSQEKAWDLKSLYERSWCSLEQLQFLEQMHRDKKSFLVVGTTGSGKTTVLNSFLKLTPNNERVVLIEDTPELVLPNSLSTKMIARHDSQNILPTIDMSELVRQSLRMRPDRIVVGEVRGAEAKDLLLALSTGHSGCFGTLHASSAEQALMRLEMLIQLGAPFWSVEIIRKLIYLSLHCILTVEKDPNGIRKLKSIYKICSLETSGLLLEEVAF